MRRVGWVVGVLVLVAVAAAAFHSVLESRAATVLAMGVGVLVLMLTLSYAQVDRVGWLLPVAAGVTIIAMLALGVFLLTVCHV